MKRRMKHQIGKRIWQTIAIMLCMILLCTGLSGCIGNLSSLFERNAADDQATHVGNVSWGMTQEEVARLEDTDTPDTQNRISHKADTSFAQLGCDAVYAFDEEGRLKQVTFTFQADIDNMTQTLRNYVRVENEMLKSYGKGQEAYEWKVGNFAGKNINEALIEGLCSKISYWESNDSRVRLVLEREGAGMTMILIFLSKEYGWG